MLGGNDSLKVFRLNLGYIEAQIGVHVQKPTRYADLMDKVDDALKESNTGSWQRKAFERLPNNLESKKHWEMFVYYRDYGVDRRKVAVAEKFGMTQSRVCEIARIYRWDRRAEAWDAALDKHRRHTQLYNIAETEFRHQQLAKKLLRIVDRESTKWDVKSEGDKNPVAGLDEIRRLMKDGVTVERLSLGQPDTITREAAEDYSKLSVDDLRELKRIQDKLTGKEDE